MAEKQKIVLIGAGSLQFGLGTAGSIMESEVLKGSEICLHDINAESLKLANIYDKIDYFLGREDLRKWKPDPEGLLKIKDHYNINEKEMIYIGDLDKDILAGKNAGIDTYFVDDLINLVNQVKS